jgi:acetyl esterase/lipase
LTAPIDIRTDIEYAVHGGQALRGKLYAPAGGTTRATCPVVIAVHGGGWQGGTPDNYQYLGPWLASHGIALMAITYRLAKVGQKSFPEAVHDVRAAVQYVKGNAATLGIDPARIALMGDSAGAHLAALVALGGDHPNFAEGTRGEPHGDLSTKVKVVVGVYGVYDLYRQWQGDLSARPRDSITEKFLGVSAIDDKRVYFDASPLSYISGKDNGTAFYLAWGTDDDVVDPASQSEAFLLALKQAGHFVRTAIFPGAPHFWAADPPEDIGGFSAGFAMRMLRFLQTRL